MELALDRIAHQLCAFPYRGRNYVQTSHAPLLIAGIQEVPRRFRGGRSVRPAPHGPTGGKGVARRRLPPTSFGNTVLNLAEELFRAHGTFTEWRALVRSAATPLYAAARGAGLQSALSAAEAAPRCSSPSGCMRALISTVRLRPECRLNDVTELSVGWLRAGPTSSNARAT